MSGEPMDLTAAVSRLRNLVAELGHRYDGRPELVGDLIDAALAAARQRRPDLAGVLSNARRAVERDEIHRATEYVAKALGMVLRRRDAA